jgi:rubrerythrin
MSAPELVIAEAVRTERETALFYRMLSEIVEDEVVSGKLVELASDEESHARSLCGIHLALTGRTIDPSAAAPEGGLDLFDVRSRSLEEVLELAIRNEQEAARLYSQQADTIGHLSTEMTLRLLAADELGHEAYLRQQVERLRGAAAS